MVEKLGLALDYEHVPYGGSLKTGPIRSKEVLFVIIKVKTSSPSKKFVTTLGIREALAKSDYKEGQEFGHIKFTYNKKTRELDYTLFFPLPLDPERLWGRRNAPKKEFSKQGIASMIETRALEEARKYFPRATKITVFKPQRAMVNRLRKFGFNHKQEIKLKEFREKLRARVAKNIRAARAKRPSMLKR
jgi:hypothetical protein